MELNRSVRTSDVDHVVISLYLASAIAQLLAEPGVDENAQP